MAVDRHSAFSSPRAKHSDAERWLAVAVRSVHLAGVVWVGAFVVTGQVTARPAAALMGVSGALMLVMDLRARRLSLRELAGAFVLVKLALVAWMVLDPDQARWIFWALLIGSSVASHAPKDLRHWPSPRR
jgi:hypothetical protein